MNVGRYVSLHRASRGRTRNAEHDRVESARRLVGATTVIECTAFLVKSDSVE